MKRVLYSGTSIANNTGTFKTANSNTQINLGYKPSIVLIECGKSRSAYFAARSTTQFLDQYGTDNGKGWINLKSYGIRDYLEINDDGFIHKSAWDTGLTATYYAWK